MSLYNLNDSHCTSTAMLLLDWTQHICYWFGVPGSE